MATVKRKHKFQYGTPLVTTVCFILLGYGWWMRRATYLKPDEGLGYILGIVGGSLMLLLLVYPLRKHMRSLRPLGSIRFWFVFHMLLGLFGPILILYHANFSLGSTNSNVALFSMLLMVTSGIIGRYVYVKIHRGLSHHRCSVDEFEQRLERFHEEIKKWDSIDEQTLSRLAGLLSSARANQRLNLFKALDALFFLPWRARWAAFWMSRHLLRQLNKAAVKQQWRPKKRRKAKQYMKKFLRRYTHTIVVEGQLALFERLFSLWHLIHMPIFIMLVLAGIFHVIAVHTY